MNIRTLRNLVVALAVLGLAAWWSNRDEGRSLEYATGQKALADLDAQALGAIELSSGTDRVSLVRSATGWVVASLWNYPADFSRLSDLARQLDDLKVGDVIRGGNDSLAEFGLANASNALPTLPVEVRLTYTNGLDAGRVVLGQPRSAGGPDVYGMPDSQYVRINEGPVLLTSPYVDDIPRRAEEWLDRTLLDFAGDSVLSMQVTHGDGVRRGVRRTESGFEGTDALSGQVISADGANLWLGTWQGLSIQSILDPASDRAALGLEQSDEVEARTRDGYTIRVQLGTPNEREERPAVISVDWEAPPLAEGLDETARAEAERAQQAAGERAMALQKRVGPWIYLLPASKAKQLTLPQEQLVVAGTPVASPAPAGEPGP